MEILRMRSAFSFFLLYFFLFCDISLSFSPVDHYLVNCGAFLDSTVDNRRFVSDSHDSTHAHLSSPQSFSLCAGTLLPALPPIYHTARVFKAQSKYVFDVKDPGTHMVRLHFHRFSTPQLNLVDSQFHVLVNGLVALTNFSGGNSLGPRVTEYLLCVHSEKLEITFVPAGKSKFAFVNAIEVISAPKDLIPETAQSLNGDKLESFEGLNQRAFEVVHRVTVGGAKVTPFNDSLWRTWVPDDEYLKSNQGSTRVYFSGSIKYQEGGASCEVGPDNVYNSARLIESKSASIPNAILSWEFPVTEDYKYLVRLHFCDIASVSLGLLFFNVHVNGHLVFKDLDPSAVTNYMLASPFYLDFVVDADPSSVVNVAVAPSNKSMAHTVDAILNGVEIMKMNNLMGSFDGKVPVESVLKCWPTRKSGRILLPMIALVCLLLSLSVFMRRRVDKADSVPWSKLPMEDPETTPKKGKQQLPSKV
ncbi:putative Ferric reduction oxidase 2 [Hibiscus syriacus]|uniref:Putative Ferric reduction oxidase 2 n=1 Tax=Hibiscus syriacus TaxID=106335 RepID=A0A6A3BXE4_HIBSY|nr:probable receptor-like protein kinase At5g24010 [Hibiscus syriacus]XP_039063675.1 probable receptor-like protein kinase At5g24010 [Hibiscus syriacus]KAE8721321.1 putative Ferric reduction oxidase 2 [Hibiscus syriacus]KAE8721453.1 putative Ferric reduction oxidase 2 [Hibiscus syriacus]